MERHKASGRFRHLLPRLLPHCNDHECIRLRPRTLRRRSRRSRFELRSRQMDRECGFIHARGPCSFRRLHYLLDFELPRLLAHYNQRSVPAGRKRQACMDLRCIHARADGQVRQHFAVVRAHHNQLLRIATADKQMVHLRVRWLLCFSNAVLIHGEVS